MNLFLFAAALLPLLSVIVCMLFFNRPAKQAIFLGWLLSLLTALRFWHQKTLAAFAWALGGALDAVGIIFIIFGAVLIMNTLKLSGAMNSIEKMFNHINPDKRIQALLIGFVFSAFLEGAAGFGTPAAITAPLLIGLGFPPVCAAMICLIYNSIPVNFGAVGTPTLTAMKIVQPDVLLAGGDPAVFMKKFTLGCAVTDALICPFIILAGLFLMCRFFGEKHRGRDAFGILPFVLFTVAVFDSFFLLTSFFLGAEFPSLLGSLLTLAVTIPAAKRRFLCPAECWDFKQDAADAAPADPDPAPDVRIGLARAWLPYILIGVLLAATRINCFGLKTLLTSPALTFSVSDLLGVPGVNWKWNWAWCPGLIPFLLASIISFAVFRMPEEAVRKSFSVTAKQCGGAAVTLCFGVSMVYLYRNTAFQSVRDYSMLQILAIYISQLFCSAYLAVAPLIGVLGAFMSGSNTVSNTLFSGLQYETARLVKLSPVLILTLQNIGGAAGNMICINNVVAVCATTGISGKEGRLIKTNVLPCLIYCAFAAVFIAFIQIFS